MIRSYATAQFFQRPSEFFFRLVHTFPIFNAGLLAYRYRIRCVCVIS